MLFIENTASSIEQLRKQLCPYHKLQFRSGEIIPEGYPKHKLELILPHIDPKGKSFLDIGSNSGFFGITMLQQGATKVLLNEVCENNREFSKYLVKYVGVQDKSQIEQHNLFPWAFERYYKQFDYVFALAMVQHEFKRTRSLNTIFRLLQYYAKEAVVLEYCGDKKEYIHPGHDYQSFKEAMKKTFESYKSLGSPLRDRELFLAKCKKGRKQFVTVAGVSQIGKKTFIKKTETDDAFRKKMGFVGRCHSYGYTFGNPVNALKNESDTIVHFWQPDTENFMMRWHKERPDCVHRIIMPTRKLENHLESFLEIQEVPEKHKGNDISFLDMIRKNQYQEMKMTGLPVEVVDAENNYQFIRESTWEDHITKMRPSKDRSISSR